MDKMKEWMTFSAVELDSNGMKKISQDRSIHRKQTGLEMEPCISHKSYDKDDLCATNGLDSHSGSQTMT